MKFSSSTIANGVPERHFVHDDVPGILWLPAARSGPLVLLGHGGGQHRRAPGVVARAHRLAALGFAAAAIDAPGHGLRPRTERDEHFAATLRDLRAAGEPIAEDIARYNADLAARAVPEWRAVLDALLEVLGPRTVGYGGTSLGTAIGMPLVAAEPRIGAAVLGLFGSPGLHATAARIAVPVEFQLQWDDELVPREAALALFDALGSAEKTLHANPGGHAGVPRSEVDSSERFFARHLT